MLPALHPIALLIATALAAHGFRKGSLSRSGAVAAFLSGYFSLANDEKAFGVVMIVFYLIGSRATKHKAHLKSLLETGHDSTTVSGNRNAFQVLCNSISGIVAAVAFRVLNQNSAKNACSIIDSSSNGSLSRALMFAALGHYACCMGDTLASELGILATSPPRLLTTFRTVPPGTNGGVTLAGLGFSLLGGLLMSLTLLATLLVESATCRGSLGLSEAIEIILVGAAGGLGGSLLDSLLGATLQRTWYSEKQKKIVTSAPSEKEEGLKVVSGWDVLSNSQVNLVCGMASALASGWWGLRN
ncbi:integral membrane protein DUF92-domain-containing protein [Mrakia frigida]|uniref:DUF92 domain-containing protein n=1 Tax=Mrakia frigida TaxID=29902 RepID=UPI003FCC206B